MKNNFNIGKVWFYIINVVIVIFVSGLTVFNIIKENGVESFSYIKNISFMSIVILTLIFFLNYYLDGVIISIAMREYNKKFKAPQGFVVQSVGGLFSAITPLKMGYLPSIGYAYSKFDVKADEVIKSMAKTSYTYQIWCLVVSVVAIIVCFNKEMIININEASLNLKYVAIIGLVYNSFLMIGYFILVLSPKFHLLLIKILSWILYKIKKVSDTERYVLEQKEKASIVRKEIVAYFKDISQFLKLFCIYVFKTMFHGALPYIIYMLVSKENFRFDLWLYTIVIGNLISYITNIIPIPGASGTAEVVFIAAFSLIFFPNTLLNSIMLIWRFFSYFINIIVGFITFVIMVYIKKKKSKEQIFTQ